MKQETIKIRYFPGAAQPLDYIDGKSDWIDLRAAERVELKAGQFRLIRLGVDPETAAADACKMEHDISHESFQAIKACILGILKEGDTE